MTTKLDLAEVKQRIGVVEDCLKEGYKPSMVRGSGPSAIKEACNRLNITRPTLNHTLTQAKSVYNLEPNWDLYNPQDSDTSPEVAVEYDEQQLRERKLHDEVLGLRNEVRRLQRQINSAGEIRELAFNLAQQRPDPPDWTLEPPDPTHHKEIPVLFTSDFQWGEVVVSEQVDNLNEYNVAIAKERYRNLINSTVDICFNHVSDPKYPGIIYLRGGDSISGAIHDELAETDELMPNPSIKSLAEEEIRGIQLLKENFGRVFVISTPGNHGRTTQKPRAKNYVELNNDDLLSWFIEMAFQMSNEKDVVFYTPRSGDAYFDVWGTKFLLTHGDRIGSRGGQGFVGPAATVMRGIYKTRRQYADIGRHIDHVCVGHFHQAMELPHGIVNGCLIGFNEYARHLRFEPEPPSQWLFFIHQKWGITQRRKIFVDSLQMKTANSLISFQ